MKGYKRNLKKIIRCVLLVTMVMCFSACQKKAVNTKDSNNGSKKQLQDSEKQTPTAIPSSYYASSDDPDHPRTISGKCGENAEWSYNTGNHQMTISGTGVVDQIIKKSEQYLSDTGNKARYQVKQVVVGEGITALDAGALFMNIGKAKGIKEIKISLPDSLEKIGTDTFDPGHLSGVWFRHIHLPCNVRDVEGGALWGLGDQIASDADSYKDNVKELSHRYKNKLTITVDSNNPYYTTQDNVLLTKDKKTLVYYPAEKTDKVYRIPKSVTKIEALAFARNSFLSEVVLPTGITEIGAGAFYGDSRLSNVNLSEAAKVKRLCDFDGVKAQICSYGARYVNSNSDDERYRDPEIYIKEFHGSGKVRKDAYMLGTFAGTNLKEIQFPNSLQYASYNTFADCFRLKKITLGSGYEGQINPVNYCDENGFLLPNEQSTDRVEIQIPAGNKTYKVRDNVVYSGDGKTVYGITKDYQKSTLTLDETVEVIARNAFSATKLQKVVAMGNLKTIGNGAFLHSERLKSFEVKGNIDTIDVEAFYFCDKLKKFVCRGSIKTIGAQAFYSTPVEDEIT